MRKPRSSCEKTTARRPYQGREQCQATTQPSPSGILFFFFNVYLFGYTWSYGSMWDLCSFLWHVGSLVLAWEFLVAVYGIWFPDQGLNLIPLHWEHSVLATGPPEKSPFQNSWFTMKRSFCAATFGG